MKTIIKKLTALSFLLLLGTVNINAATITVTTGADSGPGSLSQVIANANSGDTINFAPNVNFITLTSGQIEINKNLTIDGGNDITRKVTIDAGGRSRIFYCNMRTITINNLILKNGSDKYRGGAVYNFCGTFTATNCEFINNSAEVGGAVHTRSETFGTSTPTNCFTATNCKFINNSADIGSGAVHLSSSNSTITNCNFIGNKVVPGRGAYDASAVGVEASVCTAINCVFLDNISGDGIDAAAVTVLSNGVFIGINSVFSGNKGSGYGGAFFLSTSSIMVHYFGKDTSRVYLYHCTIDKNAVTSNGNAYSNLVASGGGIYNPPENDGELYLYNCIITGNTADGVLNQIEGSITSGGNNLIEGVNGITRELVFRNNQLTSGGYIIPFDFAATATALNNTISVPNGFTIEEILEKLTSDQIGNPRPTTGTVVYGAVEIYETLPPPPTFILIVNTTTGGATTPSGTSTRDSSEVVVIEATADSCYAFKEWSNGSTDNPLYVTITSDTTLTAYFEFICDTTSKVNFTIRASEHKLVDPRSKNFEIPIYIKADTTVSNFTIKKLIVEIYRNIFYSYSASNGNLIPQRESDFITIENLIVPALQTDTEIILTKIIGDVLLGDSSEGDIKIQIVELDFAANFEFVRGFISIEICAEGGLRLFDYSPEVIVKNNPVKEILEIEVAVIEVGDYSLEIVDMLGKSVTVKEFTADTRQQTDYNFEISVKDFANGAYIIVLNTPTNKYSARFVKQ